VITNLEDAIPGKIYTIHGTDCGAFDITITNGGNFVLPETCTLGAGRGIVLVKSAVDGLLYSINQF